MRILPGIAAALLLATSSTAWAHDVPDILYLPLEEGAGATTENRAGAGSSGALSFAGTPTWRTPGAVGAAAIEFDHSSYLPTGVDLADFGTDDFTLELWMRHGADVTNLNYLFGTGTTGFRAFTGGVASDALYVRFDTSTVASTTLVRTLTDWVHVAIVFERASDTMTLYIGGVQEGQATVPLSGSGELRFGAVDASLADGDHVLDQVRLFGHARTQAEIEATMGQSLPVPFTERFETASALLADIPATPGLANNWTYIDPFRPARPNAEPITHGTTPRVGWRVNSVTFAPLSGQSAEFSFSPSRQNYSLALLTPPIDLSGAQAGSELSFSFVRAGYSLSTTEQFGVWWIDHDAALPVWRRVFNESQTGGTVLADTITLSIPDALGSSSVQLAFVAHGENSFNIEGWYIDNIQFGLPNADPSLVVRVDGQAVLDGASPLDPPSVAGGTTYIGGIELANVGTAANLTISDISIANESNVNVHTTSFALPAPLAPGASVSLPDVYFTPGNAGPWSFTIIVESSAADSDTYEIVIEGNAEAAADGPTGRIGQIDMTRTFPTISGERSMTITAHHDTYLRSVRVVGREAGSVDIELRDNAGATLESGTFPLSGNPDGDVLSLNWFVPQGAGYRLVRVSSTTMMDADATASYPYTSSTLSITGTDHNAAWYYFFYDIRYAMNWEVAVSRNEEPIGHGEAAPLSLTANSTTQVVFSVENVGSAEIVAIDPLIVNTDNVTVDIQSLSNKIAAGTSGQLVLNVTANRRGAFEFQVEFLTSDPDRNPFVFTVVGSATVSADLGCAATGSPAGAGTLVLLGAMLLGVAFVRRRV